MCRLFSSADHGGCLNALDSTYAFEVYASHKPVPKIAVLIVFIVTSCSAGLCPPGGRRRLSNDHTVKKLRGLGQPLCRRQQAVLMFNREHVIVSEHSQRGDQFAPPLRSVSIAAGTKDPGAIVFVRVFLDVATTTEIYTLTLHDANLLKHPL